MDGISCDGCGTGLLIDADVRYLVRIEVYAAYDPLEITRQDLIQDQHKDMARLIREMEGMDPQALEDQVYRRFQFDLCPKCQEAYLKDPLGLRMKTGDGRERTPGSSGEIP